MVATVVRLRARILSRTLRREPWRLVVLVLGTLWAMATLPSVVTGMVYLRRSSTEVVEPVLVLAGALLVLGWLVVPVLLPSLDDSLETRRFATSAVPPRRLVPALLAASLLGGPTVFTAILALMPVLAWSGFTATAGLVALIAAPLSWASCVVGARVTTGVMARLLGSRRSRELALLATTVVAAVTIPAVASIGSLGLDAAVARIPDVARLLGWTPLGFAWAAPAAAAAGDLTGAAARLALAALVVLALLLAWTRLVTDDLVRPIARGGRERRRADAVSSWGASPAHAVAARAWRSWTADPRYQGAILSGVLGPLVIMVLLATVVHAPAAVALGVGPFMAASIGWARHNDVALDGSAFWLHVAADVSGAADRWGRAAATLLWALPVSVAVATAGALVADRADLAPAAVGASLGLLGAGLAVSAVLSPVLPYPVPEAGGNPFSAQIGAVGASMVAQAVSSAVTGALGLPVVALLALALWRSPALSWPLLVLGAAWGALVLAAGIRVGGTVYERRQVWLLSRMR